MSRKVRCFIAASLDGFIADARGEVEWLWTDDDYGYTDFIEGVDALLIGRKTYEQVRGFGSWPYAHLRSYVFTSQALAPDPNVVFVRDEASAFIRELKAQPGGDLWLVGGGALNAACLRAGLVDELVLSIQPLLLGEGVRLFAPPFELQNLALQGSKVYDSGLIQLTYSLYPVAVNSFSMDSANENFEADELTSPISGQVTPEIEADIESQTETIPAMATISATADVPNQPARANSSPDPGIVGLWGAALVLGPLVGLLEAVGAKLIDFPFVISLLAGLGIGTMLALIARGNRRISARMVMASALLCGLLAIGTLQLGGAFLARPAMVDYFANVLPARDSPQRGGSAAIESRLTPDKTLKLYRRLQSDPSWRTRYYGVGSSLKLAGDAYWILLGLDALLLLGVGAATARATIRANATARFKRQLVATQGREKRAVAERRNPFGAVKLGNSSED